MTGTVEEVTLRITRLRTVNGEVVIVPNGEICQVTNMSRGLGAGRRRRADPDGADINRVSEILQEVNAAAFADQTLRAAAARRAERDGREELDVGYGDMRIVARTLPGKQFDVGREAAGPDRDGLQPRASG